MSTLTEKDTPKTDTGSSAPAAQPPAPKGRAKAFVIFFIVLALIAAGGLLYWLHARQFESTDDAQIDAHLNGISSRVEGSILKVYVEDNHWVKVNDPLVDLDQRDYEIALAQAEANLGQSRSRVFLQAPNVPITQIQNTTNISGGEADVATAQATLSAAQRDMESSQAKLLQAQANNAKAQSDLERYKKLVAKEEVSRQEFDAIDSTAKAQAAAVSAAQAAVESSAAIVNQRRAQVAQAQSRLAQYQRTAKEQVVARQAAVASEEAGAKASEVQVDKARLNLSYTKIVAPVAGIVMKRSAEVGMHVAAGQQLLTIAQLDDIWVTANFKETQLRNIRPKQPVTVHVDGLNEDFKGYVDDLGGATGAVTSVLPPENATGNYVKVVQRIPVRIRFNKDQTGLDRLRPGMSVVPDVRVVE